MGISINDFLNLIVDPADFSITIYDCSENKEIFSGKACKIPNKYLSSNIFSIDSPGSYKLGININSELDKTEEN